MCRSYVAIICGQVFYVVQGIPVGHPEIFVSGFDALTSKVSNLFGEVFHPAGLIGGVQIGK